MNSLLEGVWDMGGGHGEGEEGGRGKRRERPVLGSKGAALRRWTMSVMDLMVPFLVVGVGVLAGYVLGVRTEGWRGGGSVHFEVAADEELARHGCGWGGLEGLFR